MFCRKCGNKIADGALFCTSCGTKVQTIDTVKVEKTEKSEKTEEIVKVAENVENSQVNDVLSNVSGEDPVTIEDGEATTGKPIEDPIEKPIENPAESIDVPEVEDSSVEKSGNKATIFVIVFAIIAVLLLGGAIALLYMNSHKSVRIEDVAPPKATSTEDNGEAASDADTQNTANTENVENTQTLSGTDGEVAEIETLARPVLINEDGTEEELKNIVAKFPEYTVESDFSNVVNAGDYSYMLEDEDIKNHLLTDGFVVRDDYGKEFYEVYESNRYGQLPNFVTVDSLMHTYHIYFAYLMRSIEKDYLYDALVSMTDKMVDASYNQYLAATDDNWKEAALRNVSFFSVGKVLLDDDSNFPEEVSSVVNEEYSHVMKAEGIDMSSIREDYEDYTQYIPRGYYEGDEILEKYFRTMMWYGRIQFNEDNESMDRSSLLMTIAMDETCKSEWESIYSVTSFFAGASDDLGYYEYKPAIDEVYGSGANVESVFADLEKFDEFHKLTAGLRAPKINSIPIERGDDNVIPGFRFMGQRFTIDATIMQELIYSRTGDSENPRMLPDVLDVPAALGSEMAYQILDAAGETEYVNYNENLENLIKEFNNDDDTLWNASLYANWLNTLRPLLEEKGSGYPEFMQSDNWKLKNLETFSGSYTELKHDTVLYGKQPMAEMGGGWDEEIDDRGFVEPEPVVYYRFARLTNSMSSVLKEYGYISKADEENLNRLANIATNLQTISVKELNGEELTSEEHDFIRDYGGEIEHLWFEALKAQTGEEYPNSDLFPAAVVVDVATDPDLGVVLELGTANPAAIYVVVEVAGKVKICRGSVYSFYEFVQPMDDRLTDKKWRKMLGIDIEDYSDPYKDVVDVEHPGWVNSYRCE